MNLRKDDDYVWSASFKRLPEKKLGIPGLHVIGYSNFNKVGEALESHYHECMELVVLINGSQRYIVDDDQYLLYGGKMFVTGPNEVHGNDNLPQNVCEFIWFQLDLSVIENFLGMESARGEYLRKCLAENKERIIDVEGKDLSLITEAWDGLSSENRGDNIWGCACLVQFLCKYFCAGRRSESGVSQDIKEALKYINNNILGDISIAAIAKQVGLSESHFKSKFRRQMGITPLGYITSQKMETAKYLLKRSPLSITQIAFQLNYSSSNYFATVFKQYSGYSPSEYRGNVPLDKK